MYEKLSYPSTITALFHRMIPLQGITVAGQHGPPGRSAVAALQRTIQPCVDGGEVPAHKNILQKLLRQIQSMGAAEFQHLFRIRIHFKGHVEGAIDAGDGIVRIGAGLANDILIAAGGCGVIHGIALSHWILRKTAKRHQLHFP